MRSEAKYRRVNSCAQQVIADAVELNSTLEGMASGKFANQVSRVSVESATTGNVKQRVGEAREILSSGSEAKAGWCRASRSLIDHTKLATDGRNTIVAQLLVEEAVSAACGQNQSGSRSPNQGSGGVVRALATTLILK